MTTAIDPAAVDPRAVAALRRARLKHRVANLDFFDALYKAYLTAIVAGIAIVLLSGVTGDKAATKAQVVTVTQHGAAVLGLVIAAGVGIALRSAGKGGPLALEAADVRHVLLAPIDRRVALRGPALQQLRSGAAAGAGAGAVAGVVAWRVLPGAPVAWIFAGAVTGTLGAIGALGIGLAGSGWRIHRWVANLAALMIIAWSVADLVESTRTSPFTFLGELALWPLRVELAAFIGVALCVVLAVLGVTQVGGLSLEAAERRATLVGQLRFAATTRDMRAVMVLHRQLSQERPRVRPWLGVVRRPGQSLGLAVWKRDCQGFLRWPGRRIIRLLVLGGIAGVCMRLVWSGTTPLVVVAAIALWVAALDAVEPLAQEIDRTDRLSSFPHAEGWVQVRHLVLPCVLMVVVALVGVGAALAFGGQLDVVSAVGGVTVVPAALAAVGGAGVSVVRETNLAGDIMTPELAGIKMLARELMPPAIAFIGLIPVLVAHRAFVHHQLAFQASITPAVFCLLAPGAVFAWLSRRPSRLAGPAPDRLGQA
ncbi:MAG: hypothetical protein ACREOA_08030 [Candidatus Dormibacteria bacterium]